MADTISGAILAGGQSSRMGRNKAFVKVGDIPLIERVISRLRPITNDLVIIANEPDEYTHLSLSVHHDIIPGKAALGGLYTAIAQTKGEHTVVVSCDQPFINTQLIQYLLDLRGGYDVVIPLNDEGYPQSMHAVYSKHCLLPIREKLDKDQLKVIGFFPAVRVREVTGEEIDRFDPERHSFFNVNTPQHLQKANDVARSLE